MPVHARHRRAAARTLLAAASLLGAAGALAADAPAPADGVLRSELFEFAKGDRIEDSGRFRIESGRSPRFSRTEFFEVVRRADGGRTVTNVTVGDGESYRIEGRFHYEPDETAGPVRGLGIYENEPVVIEATGGEPGATIAFERAGERSADTAECPGGCLVDLAPSAMPMFTMTRRYDTDAGGLQPFRWIGRSLLVDQVLLDGVAKIELLGESRFGPDGTTVLQYAFSERIRNEQSGEYIDVAYNLYTDAEQRPLAFVVGSTVGERAGYEGLTEAIPPRLPGAE